MLYHNSSVESRKDLWQTFNMFVLLFLCFLFDGLRIGYFCLNSSSFLRWTIWICRFASQFQTSSQARSLCWVRKDRIKGNAFSWSATSIKERYLGSLSCSQFFNPTKHSRRGTTFCCNHLTAKEEEKVHQQHSMAIRAVSRNTLSSNRSCARTQSLRWLASTLSWSPNRDLD